MNRQDKRRVERAADATSDELLRKLSEALLNDEETLMALERIRGDIVDTVTTIKAGKPEPKQAGAFSS